MRCPFCANDDSQVKDSRPTEDGGAIRRRRQCPACGARFTTFERVQLRELTVVKKNGKREAFDREKLARSIRLACRKRPVPLDRIEQMASGIARQLESSGDSEIDVRRIGECIMDALHEVDEVAYIRFASVYKNFHEADDFVKAVDALGGLLPDGTPELPLPTPPKARNR
jgi:transcriptional repressor NrdR